MSTARVKRPSAPKRLHLSHVERLHRQFSTDPHHREYLTDLSRRALLRYCEGAVFVAGEVRTLQSKVALQAKRGLPRQWLVWTEPLTDAVVEAHESVVPAPAPTQSFGDRVG